MAFLGNNAINRINLHFGVMAFAQMGGTVFFLAFLLHAGVPVAAALVAQAAIHVARFAIRPVILPWAADRSALGGGRRGPGHGPAVSALWPRSTASDRRF